MQHQQATHAQPKQTIQFENVCAAGRHPKYAGLRNVSFGLEPGSLLLIRPMPGSEALALPDLCQGLIKPDSGLVRFLGNDWQELSPSAQESLRGRIGRVFHQPGFLSNLSVADNVMLSQLHHTRRPHQEILEEADSLARAVGLNGLPSGRPAWCSRRDLRRAEWVRAFLGNPAMALLESPDEGVNPEHIPLLLKIINQALAAGAVVVAISDNAAIWSETAFSGKTRRFRMEHEQMLQA